MSPNTRTPEEEAYARYAAGLPCVCGRHDPTLCLFFGAHWRPGEDDSTEHTDDRPEDAA